MHILVYMYVFIYCKLESFLILTRYIRKLGRHGFNGEQSGEGEPEEQSFLKRLFSQVVKLEIV